MFWFVVIIGATLIADGFLFAGLMWAYHQPRFAHRRLHHKRMKVDPRARARHLIRNAVLSGVTTIGLIALLAGTVLSFEAGPTWYVILAQAATIIVAYDLLYYWMHRTLHHKKLMRWVHGVHHRVRNPTAIESLYLSPIELLAGLLLLVTTTALVDAVWPVHGLAFAVAFVPYSTLNIVNHMGMELPGRVFAPLNWLARKHHIHHSGDFTKNYATLTPIPDALFGTVG